LEDKESAKLDAWLVIGEVVGIHIDQAMLEDGIYQTARPRRILRGGGPADYFETTTDQLFKMKRPD
ncbi:MAG: flavin reductase family protein, partial [Alteraurantiacibacter sp.]